jgi:hypothetical protein
VIGSAYRRDQKARRESEARHGCEALKVTAAVQRFRHEFVLHSGIAVRWWLRDLPNAELAERFLYRDLATGTIRLLAIDGIEHSIMMRPADDLGPFHLHPTIASALGDDYHRLLAGMVEDGILVLVRQQILARQAFVTATNYNVRYVDALSLEAAEVFGAPLLFEAGDIGDSLRIVAAERPGLQLRPLHEVVDP